MHPAVENAPIWWRAGAQMAYQERMTHSVRLTARIRPMRETVNPYGRLIRENFLVETLLANYCCCFSAVPTTACTSRRPITLPGLYRKDKSENLPELEQSWSDPDEQKRGGTTTHRRYSGLLGRAEERFRERYPGPQAPSVLLRRYRGLTPDTDCLERCGKHKKRSIEEPQLGKRDIQKQRSDERGLACCCAEGAL